MENTKGMKLFLDDVRNPSDCAKYMYKRIGDLNPIYIEGEWFIVRNYKQFCDAVDKYHIEITHVSFDHDLAEAHYHESMTEDGKVYMKYLETVSEKTGYECAEYLKEFYRACGLELPIMFVHSMNPVGTERIINLFKKSNNL